MPLYTEPDEPGFRRLEERFAWFAGVLEVEYGEREADRDTPSALNWLSLLPEDIRWDIEEVECALAFEESGGYACTVWDASGEDDLPWAVFLVDHLGPRLLSEYSVLDPEADEDAVEAALRRAQDELPDRLIAKEFHRAGDSAPVPEWLYPGPDTEDEA